MMGLSMDTVVAERPASATSYKSNTCWVAMCPPGSSGTALATIGLPSSSAMMRYHMANTG